jgi:hypothetical protein
MIINLYYVGRIVKRQKRIDKLIILLRTLISFEIPFKIDIFGDGDFFIKRKLMSLSVDNFKVNFHGFKENWVDIISQDSIQIFLSDYEGCPLSLLEAYKNGKKNMISLANPGLTPYFSKNCLCDNIEHMAISIKNYSDVINYNDLSIFFDKKRFYNEVINFQKELNG